MRRAGIIPRHHTGGGFPWNYAPGSPALPAETRHGYNANPPPLPRAEGEHAAFRLILTGNPMSDPRPRGPWVTGPARVFPRPAVTGLRMPGGQGTDLGDQSTWQRQYALYDPAAEPTSRITDTR